MLYVLDASAVLNDFSFSFSPEHSYVVTSEVMDELRDLRSKQLAENALHTGLLRIVSPGEKHSAEAKSLAEEHGFSLSKADLSVLALAMQFKGEGKEFEVVTDDYSLQNFLKMLKIPFSAVIQGEIKRVLSFRKKPKTR